MVDHKPTIVLVFPGPKYYLDEFFRYRLELLSEWFQGVVYTEGPTAAREKYGNFLVNRLASDDDSQKLPAKIFAERILRDIQRDLNACAAGHVSLVVAYDPLKAGFVSHQISRRFRAPLAIEVNGDFWKPECHLDCGQRHRGTIPCSFSLVFCALRTFFCIWRAIAARRSARANWGKVKSYCRLYSGFCGHAPVRKPGEEKVVLSVGHPFLTKGIDVLLAAFRALESDFGDWRLRVVGHYPDKTVFSDQPGASFPIRVDGCRVLFKDAGADRTLRGICTCVQIRGHGTGPARERCRCKAPRRYASGGIPTVVRDGIDGLLVEPEQSDQLEGALRRLLSSEAIRRQFGEAAAHRVAVEFSRSNGP